MVLAAAGGTSCILLFLTPVVVVDCLNEIFKHNLTNPLHTCTAIYSDCAIQPDAELFEIGVSLFEDNYPYIASSFQWKVKCCK